MEIALNNEKLISIVVPMFNCEKTIDRCIKSVCNQTFENWELLLVDDGSSDKTPIQCKEWATKNDKIKVLTKENGGPSSARNYGIENAKGDYLVFLDSDDFFDDDYLLSLSESIDKEEVDTIFCGYKAVYESGELAETVYPDYENDIYEQRETNNLISRFIGYSMDDFYSKLNGSYNKKREFAAVWRFCYSVEIIKKNNIKFDEEVIFGEDIIFNSLYLAFSEKLLISNIASYNYLYNESGMVQKFLKGNGLELCDHKIKLMEARKRITKQIYQKQNYDISGMWQGSVLFSVMHIGLTLTNTKDCKFKTKYKTFSKYAKSDICKKVCKILRLKKLGFKYKLCYLPIKLHAYAFQYFVLKIASILNITPGVEDQ